ncbi:hypothetical protein CYMTET_56804, partial [Cymbomonas tetramitiformis]
GVGEGPRSAHYSLDLPDEGELDLQCSAQTYASYGWDTYYRRAALSLGEAGATPSSCVAVTGSCAAGSSAAMFVFYYGSGAGRGAPRTVHLEARGDSWNQAAKAIVQALETAGVKRGQILSIDAHNNSPAGDAIFSAHYNPGLPAADEAPLKVFFSPQNAMYAWDTFYRNASTHIESALPSCKDIICITGSCNEGGGAVMYVFAYGDCKDIQYLETRSFSWQQAADDLISHLEAAGVQRGQVLSIDAHNNIPDGDAIMSCHYCQKLPAKGTLKINYFLQNSTKKNCELYHNIRVAATELPIEEWHDLGGSGGKLVHPLFDMTSEMIQIYNDRGSGAAVDVSVWRPVLPAGCVLLGDHVKVGYENPISSAIIGKDDGTSFAEPAGFELEWVQQRGNVSLYVWCPLPPEGYVTLGFVGTTSRGPPSTAVVRCVAKDLVTPSEVGTQIWNDAGSGGRDGAFWSTPHGLGYITSGTHERPSGRPAYRVSTRNV